MTNYRISSAKKRAPTKRRSSRTSRKAKTAWADPTVPIKKISKTKSNIKQIPPLSYWWFG